MNIEQIETKKLIPYARNAKTHSEWQVKQIAASIKEFGFTSPVLIDSENVLIAGHGRVMAADLLGLDYIPCICLHELSENQKKAYRLVDNRLSEVGTSWDSELLQLELESIDFDDMQFDLENLQFEDIFKNEDDDDDTDILDPTESSTEELDPESYEFSHRCPKCGFEWDDDE